MKSVKQKLFVFFYKLRHWEYWSMYVVYFPMCFVWLYYAIKARSLFFFNATNPSLKNGGMAMEEKSQIYALIPTQYYPTTLLIQPQENQAFVLEKMQTQRLDFPLIAKPDIGLRGLGVQLISTEKELFSYHQKRVQPYLLQPFIDYPHEIGIFYVRYPHKKEGQITGIVAKEMMQVVGDGKSTLAELIAQNPRYLLQIEALKLVYQARFHQIIPLDERIELLPYGNHSRGAKFIDASDRITPQLTQSIHEICRQIPQFYYGRLDVKFRSWEELAEGKYLSIIELNGVASEPTHIYDPKHSLFFAWKEIARHLNMMYEIGKMNHQKGENYLALLEVKAMLSAHFQLVHELKKFQ